MGQETYESPLAVVEQFFFCGVPLRLDTYSGCDYDCHYCFARARDYGIGIGHYVRGNKVIPTNPAIVKRALVKALDWDTKSSDIIIEWLRHHVPIHWGGMSDPFVTLERKLHVSRDIIDYLNWYQYPTVISTKSTIPAEPDYLARLKEGKYAIQISLLTDDNKLSKKLEPHAPSASERLKALETLARNNLWTACRIQPLIPASPIECNLVNFVSKLANVGVKHIVIEGYKPPIWAKVGRKAVDIACGGKVELEYQLVGARQEGMEMLLPSWRKWQYIEPVIETAHKYGITFGAADNDFRDMGDVKCCCGIDNLAGFENYWQYQTARMAEIGKQKGVVSLNDLADEWVGKCKFGFNKQGLTIEDGIRLRAPVKYYIDKVWHLGDLRSLNCLVNFEQVYHNGKVCYRYKDSTSNLKTLEAKQGILI